MRDSLVIIPTYNEKDNIPKMLRKVFSLSHPFDVLIVDDGSPDGTGAIVKDLQNEFGGRLHLLERSGKQGLGTAYIAGFRFAIEKGYDFIFEMDADFSHDPEDLVRLYVTCREEGYDLAVGSRYVSGGRVVNWPISRILISYFASVYVRLVTWMPVRDTTAGFVCYRKKVLETLNLDKIRFIGYAFQIEMKFATWKLGFKIKEIPIIFTDRVEGVSKMSKGIVKEAVMGVIQIQWNSWFNSYRKN